MLNKKLADFTLPSTGDRTFSLKEHAGTNLVIYFYPKDSTPGCTTQGQNFRDAYDAFRKANCEIVGISRDGIKSHENFKAKQGFPFDLLSDVDEIACNQFDGDQDEEACTASKCAASSAAPSLSTPRALCAPNGAGSRCPAMSTRC